VVGAPGANGGAGLVWVIADPLGKVGPAGAQRFTLRSAAVDFGWKVATGDVNNDGIADVIASTNGQTRNSGNVQVNVFNGPIAGNNQPANYVLVPTPGLDQGWGTTMDVADVDGDGLSDVMVGAPNATLNQTCGSSPGVAYLFLGSSFINSPQPASGIRFESPVLETDFMGFGFGVSLIPATSFTSNPMVGIGENGGNVNGASGYGQVFIYRKQ
jgi:hypothetical protein